MDISTTFVRKEQAIEFLQDVKFRKEWQELSVHSLGFRQLQSFDLLSVWYQVYKKRFDPILIFSRIEKKELVGFIALAWDKEENAIVHAGNAEYHGWLAKETATIPFLRDVLKIVKDDFQVKKWSWTWLPSGLNIAHLKAATDGEFYIHVESEPAPIWNLKDEERLNKLLKSRSVKSKINRYKRRGDLRFEVVGDGARVREVLETAQFQCDFRREALNNNRPFYEDPYKIEFAAELTDLNGGGHVCAMWLDDQLLACHVGVEDGNRVCLGMISHDPSESKQSPGTLLLIKLATHLREKGYNLFDLTPGTNSYKDRFANAYEVLHRPTICFSSGSKWKVKMEKMVVTLGKQLLDRVKVDVPTMRRWKTNLQESPQKIKRLTQIQAAPRIGRAYFRKKQLFEVDWEKVSAGSEDLSLVERQNYADLLKYQDTHPFLMRRGLLQDALSKFAKGEILFSKCQNEKLQWYCWMKDVKNLGKYYKGAESEVLDEPVEILYDFYSSPETDSKIFEEYLLEVLRGFSLKGGKRLFLFIEKRTFNSFHYVKDFLEQL